MASPARRRRLLILSPVVLAVVAGGVVATTQVLGRGSSTSPRGPVAEVAGARIPASLFDLRITSALTAIKQAGGAPEPGDPHYPAFLAGVRRRVMESLIVDRVITQEAAFRHLAASDADVASEVAADVRAAGGRDKLDRQLAEAGGNLDQLRDAIRSRLNEQRLEDLFASERAADVEARLAAGTPFETVASQLSDDERSRPKGGDLGAVNLAQLSGSNASFVAAVRSAPEKRVSEPIRDDAGYEILRLDAQTPTTRSLHRILVAAPRPYTVRERPPWFSAAIFQAISDDCQAGRLRVLLDVGLQPCAPNRPAPGPATAAPRASSAPDDGGTGTGFTPRP
jgi:parvulin-like peptidyl-prolyl isomerase